MKAKYLFSAAIFLAAGCLGAQAIGVIGWGQNTNGQTTTPSNATNVIAIAAGGDSPSLISSSTGYSLALKSKGTIVGWGSDARKQLDVPPTATNLTAIAAGEYHAVALRADGKVFAWGTNIFGQTNVPASLASNVIAIAAGGSAGDHSLALKIDGTVVAWGNNNNRQTNVPAAATNVVAIAAGSQYSMALRLDGTVVVWGSDNFGQTNIPPSATNLVAIAAGSFHCMGLKTNGTVIVWGDNNNGQTNVPPTASNVVAIAAGEEHSMALRRDGTIVVWGNTNNYMFDLPAGVSNVTAIASSSRHALALFGDGTPGITIPPRDQSIYPGNTATFMVMAAGPENLAYQWKFNDVTIAGATGPVLILTNVQPAKSGFYQVTVRNSFGSDSAGAGLTLLDGRLNFLQQPPASATLGVNSNLTLSVSLAGATPMSFQWLKNGAPISSTATNFNYTIINAKTNDSGAYSVLVSNAYTSSLLSTTDNVSVVYFKPTILFTPVGGNIALGSDFTLSVVQSGTTPFSWQWRTNGIPITGATNSSYLISPAQFTDAGLYDVVITNLGGSVTSAVAIVTVGFVEGPISNPTNGHQYFIVNPGTWTVARAEAQALGGDLVTIRSDTENSWIVANLLINYSSVNGPDLSRAPLWIGMIDPITNDGGGSQHVNDFVWADGETSAYRHWNTGTGEPNNNGNFEYYGAISWQWAAGGGNETQGTWNDTGLNGTSFAGGTGGNGIGPYYGIAEIGGSAVSLTIGVTNSLITITPVPSLAGQIIQATTNLGAPAQWNPVWTNDGTAPYTVSPDTTNRFFRLVH